MEQLQRNDRKLREAAAKRRQNGGPKISYDVYKPKEDTKGKKSKKWWATLYPQYNQISQNI